MHYHRLALSLVLLLTAGSAAAHPGHETAGFFAGFAHPLGGLDHLLAMLAVGLLAARQGGAARRMLPAGFLLALLAGAGLAWAGLGLPGVETGIAGSVLMLGLLIAAFARPLPALCLALVALFGLAHGYAHAMEAGAGGLTGHALGFLLASGLVQAAGYALACWLPERPWAASLRRLAGAAIAGAGAVLLGA